MAETQQTSTFPAPPPFFKHFTNENLRQVKQQPDILQLPTELRYLIPPAPPAEGRWRAFGFEQQLDAPEQKLEDLDVERLVPDRLSIKLSPQPYLIALARSLLTKFLEICGILAQNPSLYEEKLKHLRELALNMHYLINQYRPHEARESLITMMEDHVAQLRDEITTIEGLKSKLEAAISGSALQKDDPQSDEVSTGDQQQRSAPSDLQQARQRRAWRMLADLSGNVKHEEASQEHEVG